eukprot:s815_g13.t1
MLICKPSSNSREAESLSTRVFELALGGLRSTSRIRDASAWMLAKFFVRGDVSDSGFLQSFVTWTRQCWPVAGERFTQRALFNSSRHHGTTADRNPA